MREQRRDIDINRGQGRAGACFVIRAPLTSEVVNLRERCPDRASFEAISDFSRGSGPTAFCPSFIPHPEKMPRADVILLPHPAGCTHLSRHLCETSNYAKCDPIYDGYARCESRRYSCVDIRPSASFVSLIRPDCQILAQSTRPW